MADLLVMDMVDHKMRYKVEIEVEANNGEDACYRVLGWQPSFVKRATVVENGARTEYRLGRRGYDGWEPAWIKQSQSSAPVVQPSTPRSIQHLVNQWQARWLTVLDVPRDAESDLVERITAFTTSKGAGDDHQ